MDEKILNILEKNSRISLEEIAIMLGIELKEVASRIQTMVDDKIICGFNTLINWDKTGKQYVSALIEVKVLPTRGLGFDKIAKRIYQYEEVKSVFLMSGGYDLTVIVEGDDIRDVSLFVSDKLSTLESVQGTATHFVLKKYKDHGIIFSSNETGDDRMIVSP